MFLSASQSFQNHVGLDVLPFWFRHGLIVLKGKVCVLTRSLYGLKSSGVSLREALADALRSMEFESTLADPNVWIKRARKPDGYEYYEMLLVYTDDILIISHQCDPIADEIDNHYKIKPESRKAPEIYLGADVAKVQTAGGHEVWSTSSKSYVQNAVKVVENLLIEDGKGMQLRSPSKAKNPLPTICPPEVDITAKLNADLIPRYLQLIGMLRWASSSSSTSPTAGRNRKTMAPSCRA